MNGPTVAPSPGTAVRSSHQVGHLVLLELALQELERERRAVHGHVGRVSRSRYGSAPMWSSCPCVSTTASTWSASRRARSRSPAGRGRSRACRPRGTRDRRRRSGCRSSSSTQAMLRPTSPTPPRKTTRQRLSVRGDRRPPAPCGRGRVPRSSPGRAAAAAAPAGRPTISRAALTGIGFDVTNSALNSGDSVLVDLAGRRHVARARSARSSAGSAGRRGGSRRSRRPTAPRQTYPKVAQSSPE